MRAESDGSTRRVARKRRGIPFRIQVGLVALIAVAVGYGVGYYAIAMLTMPQASAGETLVSSPRPAPAIPAGGSTGAAGGTAARETAATGEAAAPTVSSSPAPAQEAARPGSESAGLYRVQVGAFSDRERAQALADQLASQGFEASITSGPPYRVQAGAFRNEAGAAARLEALREAGYRDAFIQRTSP